MHFCSQAHVLKVFCRFPLSMRLVKSERKWVFCNYVVMVCLCPLSVSCEHSFWSIDFVWIHPDSFYEGIQYIG